MKKILILAIAISVLGFPSLVHAKKYPSIKCRNHYDIITMIATSEEMMYQVITLCGVNHDATHR